MYSTLKLQAVTMTATPAGLARQDSSIAAYLLDKAGVQVECSGNGANAAQERRF
jgi:hypothetical protein